MPTTAQEQESPEPPPRNLGAATLETECFPPGARQRGEERSEGAPGVRAASEAELLGSMAEEQTNPEGAREAWAELYKRHARYISVVAGRAFGSRLGTPDRVADAVADTLQAAFDWAGRQPSAEQLVAKFNDPDPDAIRRKVLGWFAVVARRIVAERIVDAGDRPHQLHGEVEVPEVDDDPPPSGLQSLLGSALEKLSPLELEALRESLPWYEPESREFSFPRGEAQRVAASLGVTPDTLRQRRHRSMKRLKSLLQASGATERSEA